MTDAEIYARLMGSRDSATAVTRLAAEMHHGDATTVRDTTYDLKDFATAREVAAIKRHIRALAGQEG